MTETYLEMVRGDDQTWSFTVKDSAGVVVDITGTDLRFEAKADVSDAAATIEATTGGGEITLTDPTNGVCQVHLAPADTSGLTKTVRLRYDLQLRDTVNEVHTVARGRLDVIADVSVPVP